ncbi:MAG TPA: phosphatase PAP2 family protein, partial [Gammaproteobacteria bacterium]|nr:phosphatase PAP2 family protein [Gammaproteobacteria bacterium]
LLSGVVKDLVARPRPCDALEGVRMLVGCGGAFSFPSAHASNIFAAMVPLAVRVKRAWPAFIALAFTVAYSRVYVGAHYPSDVLAGTVLGTAVAVGFLLLEKRYGGPLRERLVFGGRGADTGKKNETSGQDKD